MQVMAKKAGFKFEIDFLPLDVAMAGIKNNEVELTLNQGYSEKRAAHMLFGKYPFRVKAAIFSKTGRADVRSLKALAGKAGITKARGIGVRSDVLDTDILPTFHPAYLLRNPKDKRLVWEDMKKIKREFKHS